MNWIKKHYPIGAKINIARMSTGNVEPAEIVNHIQGSGFKARHTGGLVVRFADGQTQKVDAAYLDEEGGDRA